MKKLMIRKRNQDGFTLTEMLATVLIMSIVTTSIVAGVSVVKDNFKNVQNKANAQVLLSTTVAELTDRFAFASEIKGGESSNPRFLLDIGGQWIVLKNSSDGIVYQLCKAEDDPANFGKYIVTEDTSKAPALLVTKEAQAGLICYYDEYTYSSSGYFTIKNLRVYEKEGFDPSHPENSEVLATLPEEYSIECLNGSLTPR